MRNHPMLFFIFFLMIYSFTSFILIPLLLHIRPDSIPGYLIRDFGYMNIIKGFRHIPDHPILLAFFGYGFSPSLAGITVSVLGWGKEGIVKLLRGLRPWGKGISPWKGLKVYLVILIGFLAATAILVGLHYIINAGTSSGAVNSPFIGVTLGAFVSAILVGFFLQPAGILEEIFGFRGYALPTLLERLRNPIKASVVLGFIWFFWHLLVPFSPFLTETSAFKDIRFWTSGLLPFMGYMLIANVFFSIVITYFWLKSGGSVWAGIVFHGLLNTIPFGLQINLGGSAFTSQKDVIYSTVEAIFAVVAACLVIWVGRNILGQRKNL